MWFSTCFWDRVSLSLELTGLVDWLAPELQDAQSLFLLPPIQHWGCRISPRVKITQLGSPCLYNKYFTDLAISPASEFILIHFCSSLEIAEPDYSRNSLFFLFLPNPLSFVEAGGPQTPNSLASISWAVGLQECMTMPSHEILSGTWILNEMFFFFSHTEPLSICVICHKVHG